MSDQATTRPIIDEATYNAAIIGARNRFQSRRAPEAASPVSAERVIACDYGHPMHGDCKVSRGQEWRYYRCRLCDAPSVPADAAERVVIEAVSEMTLPASVIDRARAELARRLDVPQADLACTKRRRLEGRLDRLTQLYGWGNSKPTTTAARCRTPGRCWPRCPTPTSSSPSTATARS